MPVHSVKGGVILKPVLWVVGDQVDVPEPIIVFTKGFNCAASVQARPVPGSLRQQFVSRLEPMVQGLIPDTAIWRTSFNLHHFRHTETYLPAIAVHFCVRSKSQAPTYPPASP